MIHAAREALTAWTLHGADLSLVAQRENIVFRVTHDGRDFALRLHRPGYQSRKMIRSELSWMQYLGSEGLNVPEPLATRSGDMLSETGEYHADLLIWLGGRPMGATGKPLDLQDRAGVFQKAGSLLAQVHAASDRWTLPDGFQRKRWDIDGLLGAEPLWDRFWDNPGLDPAQRRQVLLARDHLREDLSRDTLDFGLIHADMLRENVMIDGDRLGLIDFDDSGFGFRLFDVATALFKNRSEPDYADLEAAFLAGYRSVRPIDTTLMEQVMVIRALTYLGWIISRMDEPGAARRQHRFLAAALPMVARYLAKR